MGHSTRRRAGAFVLLAGLVLVGLASFAGSAGAITPADNDNKVCNNQSGDTSKDCVGDKYHGDVATSFDANGNLVFTVTAANGFTDGWKALYICIPGTPRTKSADCQGNTASVLSPTKYNVTLPAVNTEEDKSVSFACSTAVTAVVDKSALPAGAFAWTLHLNSCGGSTDEAFGSADTTPPPVDDFFYRCVAPTNVTPTSATLNADTNNSNVTKAEFAITSGPTVSDDTPSAATPRFSASVSGLAPNTVYTYKVDFLTSATDVVGTASGCEFATGQLHTYACAAPQNVTQTAARLRGSTDDPAVTGATFTAGSGSPVAGTSDGSGGWQADVTGLPAGATTAYTVSFDDGASEIGSAACQVATAAVVIPATQETPQPPAVAPAAEERPTEVAGVEVTRTEPAPAATQPAQLARTGAGRTLVPLAGVGLLLLLLGTALVVVRPSGDHYA